MTTDALPLPDFDHLPLGNLAEHVRPLDRDQLQTLLEHERAHGNRLPVVEVLTARVAALEAGAEPTGSVPEHLPEVQQGAAGSPAVTPATAGPVVNPPSHGDPTNPAQPR